MFPIGWAEPGCKGSIERRRVARVEISRHEHLQRALFPIWGGFDTLDCSFLDDVEVFGRVAFSKNEAATAVGGCGQFLKHTLARRS